MRAEANLPLFVLLLSSSTALQGAEWKIDPTLRFGVGYNDNLRFSTENELSSAEASVSPNVVFSVMNPASGASGDLRLDARRYEEDSDLNVETYTLAVGGFHSWERSRLGVNLSAVKDTTLDSQLEETGLVFARVNRRSLRASPTWSYNFSERTRVSASYNYNQTDYQGGDDTGFSDYSSNALQASLARVVNERTVATISASRSSSDNENGVDTTSLGVQGGVSYAASETLSGSLFVGARRSEQNFSRTSLIPILSGNTIIGLVPLTQDITTSDSGTTFSASLEKKFLRGATALSASRDISVDVNGRPTEITRLRWTNSYRFTELLTGSLQLQYSTSAFDNAGDNVRQDNYHVEPTLTWAFKQFWSLSGSYRYRRQTFDDTSDEAIQNAAHLTLTYGWPRIAVSR